MFPFPHSQFSKHNKADIIISQNVLKTDLSKSSEDEDYNINKLNLKMNNNKNLNISLLDLSEETNKTSNNQDFFQMCNFKSINNIIHKSISYSNKTIKNKNSNNVFSNLEYNSYNLNKLVIWDYQDENTFLYENFLDYPIETKENYKEYKYDDKHYQHFISAGIACMISRTITAPLERLKILYQVNISKSPNILSGLIQVYKKDGFTGLFRGNTMSLLKSTPDTAIKFYFFEKTKYLLKTHPEEELSSNKLFIAGATGGVIANIAVFPLDVIKTRISAAPNGTYNGIIDAIEKISKENGARSFYKGIQASICCTIPNTGLNLSFYELLKRLFGAKGGTTNLPTLTIMFIGGLSAMISSTILYPLQTIQSRLIMNGVQGCMTNGVVISKGMIGMINHTLINEGYKGFFKGYGPGITKIILGNALGFSLYENIKKLL